MLIYKPYTISWGTTGTTHGSPYSYDTHVPVLFYGPSFKPGRYPLWSFYYFRWWLVTRFQTLSWAEMFSGTPLMSLYWRAMGAKVAAVNVMPGHTKIVTTDGQGLAIDIDGDELDQELARYRQLRGDGPT